MIEQTLPALINDTTGVPDAGARIMSEQTRVWEDASLPELTLETLELKSDAMQAAQLELKQLLDNSFKRPQQLLAIYSEYAHRGTPSSSSSSSSHLVIFLLVTPPPSKPGRCRSSSPVTTHSSKASSSS